jgi:hypothetical protein
VGTVPVLKYLSVAAVTGGDSLSLQRKLPPSCPAVNIDAETPSQEGIAPAREGPVSGLVEQAPAHAAAFSAMVTMLQQVCAADLQ